MGKNKTPDPPAYSIPEPQPMVPLKVFKDAQDEHVAAVTSLCAAMGLVPQTGEGAPGVWEQMEKRARELVAESDLWKNAWDEMLNRILQHRDVRDRDGAEVATINTVLLMIDSCYPSPAKKEPDDAEQ